MMITEQPQQHSPLRSRIAVGSDHPAFDGHFDEFPIIAGVYQVEWAVAQLARYHGCPVRVTAIPRAKFTAMIRPNTTVLLTVSPQQQDGQRSARWRLVAADGEGQKFSEGRLEYSV